MLLQAASDFTFANQAGVDMLETTLVALQDISLEKIFDDHGRKNICSEFPLIMNQVSNQTLATNDALFLDTEALKTCFKRQGFATLPGGICLSSMGRPVSYEKAVAWKVLNDDENAHCICFMFVNWSFV